MMSAGSRFLQLAKSQGVGAKESETRRVVAALCRAVAPRLSQPATMCSGSCQSASHRRRKLQSPPVCFTVSQVQGRSSSGPRSEPSLIHLAARFSVTRVREVTGREKVRHMLTAFQQMEAANSAVVTYRQEEETTLSRQNRAFPLYCPFKNRFSYSNYNLSRLFKR